MTKPAGGNGPILKREKDRTGHRRGGCRRTNGSWQFEDIHGTCLFCGVGASGSDATVTVNNGSENIAVFRAAGDLDFYWQDSSGAFQNEIVAAAGVN